MERQRFRPRAVQDRFQWDRTSRQPYEFRLRWTRNALQEAVYHQQKSRPLGPQPLVDRPRNRPGFLSLPSDRRASPEGTVYTLDLRQGLFARYDSLIALHLPKLADTCRLSDRGVAEEPIRPEPLSGDNPIPLAYRCHRCIRNLSGLIPLSLLKRQSWHPPPTPSTLRMPKSTCHYRDENP